jgi:hypothetical protein
MYVIDERDRQFLAGPELDVGYHFPLRQQGKDFPVHRAAAVCALVGSDPVLHLGCADHPESYRKKIKEGRWLHEILSRRGPCLGVDVNQEMVQLMREDGRQDMHHADIERDLVPPEVHQDAWKWIVAGEMLEHLNSPISFLESLRRLSGSRTVQLVATVPNAWGYDLMRALRNGCELINSDHRFWFTPFTLAKNLSLAGWIPLHFDFVHAHPPGRKRLMFERIGLMKRWQRTGLVMVASL